MQSHTSNKTFGRTGIAIPQVSFDLIALPDDRNQNRVTPNDEEMQNAADIIELAVSAGITHFNTDACYGLSDQLLSYALTHLDIKRDAISIQTNLPISYNIEGFKQQFFTSLQNTGCGYFDMLTLHGTANPNNICLKQAYDWQKQGLINHIGIAISDDNANIQSHTNFAFLMIKPLKDGHTFAKVVRTAQQTGQGIMMQLPYDQALQHAISHYENDIDSFILSFKSCDDLRACMHSQLSQAKITKAAS